MFYAAAAVLLIGLAVRVYTWARRPTAPVSATPVDFVMDVVLFRGKFFDDRVSWICSALFHYGLACVVIRHLRYALNPEWLGPLWKLVILAQPLGLYGGLVLMAGVAGFGLRRLLVPELRASSSLADFAMLALLIAVPAVGYLNNFVHTDIIAVKEFFLGLVSPKWAPLPSDPLLLLHLWLVAALMMALPFSKLLHLGGLFETLPQDVVGGSQLRRNLVRVIGAVVAIGLVVPAGVGAVQVAADGWSKPLPNMETLASKHKSGDPTVMIRNHPNFLMDYRSVVVYKGARDESNQIEKCVSCHAVKGADGKPVSIEDPKHFCHECHNKAAVNIDCFECHNSKPAAAKTSSVDRRQSVAANYADVAEGSAVR